MSYLGSARRSAAARPASSQSSTRAESPRARRNASGLRRGIGLVFRMEIVSQNRAQRLGLIPAIRGAANRVAARALPEEKITAGDFHGLSPLNYA